MEVDFMLSDSLEVGYYSILGTRLPTVWQAVRPKLPMPKSIEEAASAVDVMFNTAMQTAGRMFFPPLLFILSH